MKKAAIIFLIFIYASSATGVAIKADYCCSKLESLKIVLADGARDKDGCCKIKYQSFLIKDAHAAADVLVAPALHFTFIHALNSFFATIDFDSRENNRLTDIHDPPLYQVTPVYISNCVFRI